MFKKLGIGALMVVAGLFLVKSGMGSYARTAWHKVKVTAKSEVPLEFDIDRVREDVSRLVPEMRNHLSVIAAEMVAVENLRDEVTLTRSKLNQQKENILTMRKDLDSGAKTVSYDGRSYSVSRVR